jgi:hypothetical protein
VLRTLERRGYGTRRSSKGGADRLATPGRRVVRAEVKRLCDELITQAEDEKRESRENRSGGSTGSGSRSGIGSHGNRSLPPRRLSNNFCGGSGGGGEGPKRLRVGSPNQIA